jgi:dTDP-4-amino-4,6-dideoxygalactose transaminase
MHNRLAVLGGSPVRTTDFPAWPVAGAEERAAVARVVESGTWGIGGTQTTLFETDFAAIQGARHGVCVTSGTVALRTALLAAGIRAGDEVLIPAYTFQATAGAIVEVNAVPVCVDVDANTRTMDPDDAARAITERTRFLMPVHFAGIPADLGPLLALAERHGLTLIEDAAQAHGARHSLGGVGAVGAMGCFSFQSSKNLSSGEGGIVVTNDDALAGRLNAVRNCGRFPDGSPSEPLPSGNYRMTEFQGAILAAGLARLPEQMTVRDANAKYLAQRLCAVPGITPVAMPEYVERAAWHLFPFRYDAEAIGAPREVFLKALDAEGIPATPGYTTPVYDLPLMAEDARGPFAASVGRRRECPVTERICSTEGAWLYQKMLLGTRRDTDDIASAFEKVYTLRGQLAEVTP